jgi:hypothetical protein
MGVLLFQVLFDVRSISSRMRERKIKGLQRELRELGITKIVRLKFIDSTENKVFTNYFT